MSSSNPGPAVTTGSNTMGGGSPVQVGASATDLVGFWGVTPIAQRASAAQAALTLTTATTTGVGFSTTTAFDEFVAQVEEIRATLAAAGLFKGAA